MSPIVLLAALFSTSLAGYLPPPDGYHGDERPECTCDETRISELAERLDRLENKEQYREKRQTDASQGSVAFTAYLSQAQFNMTVGETVKFERTLINEGGHYDVTTGKFTAPVDGIYLFSFMVETKHVSDTAVELLVDGVNMLDAVVEPRHFEQNLQGGNIGLIHMTAGQKASIVVFNTGDQFIEGYEFYRFTTFSGVLLHKATYEVFG